MSLTGQIIGGRYRLLSLLGESGFGATYEAEHLTQQRRYAVKVISSTLLPDEVAQDRFQAGITAVLPLSDDGLARLVDSGAEALPFFYATPLYLGGSLRKLMDDGQRAMLDSSRHPDGRISVVAAVDIIRQAALGLHAAHSSPRHVLHLALRPESILLEDLPSARAPYPGVQARIVDVGMVQALVGQGSQLNTPNGTLGDPRYLAPEQLRGEAADSHADLYALGSILFELISGRPPFDTDSIDELIFLKSQQPAPRLRQLQPTIPRELDEIVDRCLKRSTEHRFDSSASLAAALQSLLEQIAPVQEARADGVLMLDTDRILVTPGQPTVVGARIHNRGRHVAFFRIGVRGIDSSAVIGEERVVQVNPQQTESTQLQVILPRSPESVAGTYPVDFWLESHGSEGPLPGSTLSVLCEVISFHEIEVDLKPRIGEPARVWQTFSLQLESHSNTPERCEIHIKDDSDSLQPALESHMFELAPGDMVSVPLKLSRPPRWSGVAVRYPFTVEVEGVESGLSESVEGVFVQTRWWGWWMVVLCVLAAFFGVILLVGGIWLENMIADNDHVLTVFDKCPDEAEDMDGYQDDDGCPEPDNDGDGVLDVEDECPLKPGGGADGCPVDQDPDNDGVIGSADSCPEDPEDKDGFEDGDGCPDRDNDDDGIPDEKDDCPDNAEDLDSFEDSNGCPDPDNDGDGILDVADKCPTQPGPLHGCPAGAESVSDRDKDGDIDAIDQCPDTPGVKSANGCPDKDGDGVQDAEDICPTKSGPADNNGCPIGGIKQRIEAESLVSQINASVGTRNIASIVPGETGLVLLWDTDGGDDSLSLPIKVDQAGTYDVVIRALQGPEYGDIEVTLSGYGSKSIACKTQSRGVTGRIIIAEAAQLSARSYSLVIRMTSKGKKDFNVGIDYIELQPR